MPVLETADFTPLAHRFRAADRRVTIVTASPAASAYRAVADTVITADELAELVKHPEEAVEEQVAPVGNSGRGRVTGTTTEPSEGAAAESPAARAVLRLVRSADRPLNGGAVARAAQQADAALSNNWDGAGSFFPWLARSVPQVVAASGFVWDPKRFSEADVPGQGGVDLPPLQRQVVEITDIPNLPTESYRILLAALADDVAAQPFDRPVTAKRVRDACQSAGAKVGRGSVNTVISGILYAGLDLTGNPPVKKVAETWADNVIGLCRGARMELSPQDVAAIRAWVGGGLLKR